MFNYVCAYMFVLGFLQVNAGARGGPEAVVSHPPNTDAGNFSPPQKQSMLLTAELSLLP